MVLASTYLGVGGLIASLGGMALNKGASDKANKINKKQFDRTFAEQKRVNNENAATRAQALGQSKRALVDRRTGYNKALGSVSAQGVAANREIARVQRQAQARAGGRGYGAGSSSSSAQAGLQQQANVVASEAQSNVAGRLAGLRSRLFSEKGNAEAQGRAGIASTLLQTAQGNTQDNQGLQGIQLQANASKIDVGALVAALGNLAPEKKKKGAAQEPGSKRDPFDLDTVWDEATGKYIPRPAN